MTRLWTTSRLWPTIVVLLCVLSSRIDAEEWSRFRGPNGSGIAPAGNKVPTEWSDTKNLAWKVALPGPGSSSPIIVQDRIFVTCYTGYGVDGGGSGALADLKRHLFCFDVATGKELWSVSVPGTANEDPYRGFIAEHGYASSSPVSDGQRVFVFYGKAGVFAYDLNGKELWKASVGTQSGPQRWGSGASPILVGSNVVVNASEESQSLVALDQSTGKETWRAKAEGLGSTWGTPIVLGDGDTAEVVLGVPYEVWGLNAKSGKLRWFAAALDEQSYCSSVVTDGRVIYGVEGRGGQGFALKAGGKDDVTATNMLWKSRAQGRIVSPVLYEGRLYAFSRGTVQCLDAESGKQIYQSRLPRSDAAPEPRGGAGGGPGGRGGTGGQDYGSPIVADGKLYYTDRSGVTHVLQTGPEFKLLAQNSLQSDQSRHNGTPAVAGGRLFIRSDSSLYAIAESAKPTK